MSPDGTKIVVTVKDGGQDVYVWDASRGMLRQLTFDPAANSTVTWLNNERLAFSGEVERWAQIFLQTADGLGAARQLTTGLPTFPFAASPDGRLLLVREFPPDGGWDIGVVPVENPDTRRTVERTKWFEHNPVLSPDGRWLAYQSNKTGRDEIFARSFPLSGAGEIQITARGGTRPVWSRDGKSLFYWSESGEVVSIKWHPDHSGAAPELGRTDGDHQGPVRLGEYRYCVRCFRRPFPADEKRPPGRDEAQTRDRHRAELVRGAWPPRPTVNGTRHPIEV